VLTLKHLGMIERSDPFMGETLRALQDAHNGIATQTGVSHTPLPAPPNIRAIAVSAQNGQFTISITDPDGQAQSNLGLHYFLGYDTNPAFPNPTIEDIGPARGKSLQLGNLTLYWFAESSFRISPLSARVVYGGANPIAVVGGGSAVGPPPGGGSGAGGGGGGFGGGQRFSGCPLKGTRIVPLGSSSPEITEEPNADWVRIRAGECTLVASPTHRVYTAAGILALENLRPGMKVVTENGEAAVMEVCFMCFPGTRLRVEIPDGHLYFAGGILSHNVKPVLN
jgi:hypothetical protein